MKSLFLGAALAAACLAMSACSTTTASAVAPITSAVAAGLPHCHVSGSFNAGAGGLAGTGTGLAQNFTFDCPAQPWPTVTSAPTAAPAPAAPVATTPAA